MDQIEKEGLNCSVCINDDDAFGRLQFDAQTMEMRRNICKFDQNAFKISPFTRFHLFVFARVFYTSHTRVQLNSSIAAVAHFRVANNNT